MSGLVILGDTSGSVTLQAPAVAGNGTVTLPTTGGTVRTTTTPGTILQVVSSSATGEVTASAGTWTNSGVATTITPISSTSKILVFATIVQFTYANSGGNNFGSSVRLKRNTTVIWEPSGIANYWYNSTVSSSSNGQITHINNMQVLDSPATTSAITYYIEGKGSSASIIMQYGASPTILTLMEVAA